MAWPLSGRVKRACAIYGTGFPRAVSKLLKLIVKLNFETSIEFEEFYHVFQKGSKNQLLQALLPAAQNLHHIYHQCTILHPRFRFQSRPAVLTTQNRSNTTKDHQGQQRPQTRRARTHPGKNQPRTTPKLFIKSKYARRAFEGCVASLREPTKWHGR